jgi:chromosome segregation ATPase
LKASPTAKQSIPLPSQTSGKTTSTARYPRFDLDDALRAKDEEIERLREEIAFKDRTIAELREEVASLEGRCADEADILYDLDRRRSEIKAELKMTRVSVGFAALRADSLDSRATHAEHQLSEAKKMMASFLEASDEHIQKLIGERRSLEGALAESRAQTEDALRKTAALRVELEELAREHDKTRAQLEAAKERSDALRESGWDFPTDPQ